MAWGVLQCVAKAKVHLRLPPDPEKLLTMSTSAASPGRRRAAQRRFASEGSACDASASSCWLPPGATLKATP
jgi:hypothetical protein